MLQNTKSKGFTLVELLIVIVVIAILAAISIVAYNGIQDRAKTTSGNELASQVAKKIEALNAVSGSYFSDPAAGVAGSAINTAANTANADEAVLSDPSAVVAGQTTTPFGTASSDNGTQVAVVGCANGAEVYYWDFTTGAPADPIQVGAGC